jgi:hypothetical protein
LPPGKALGAGDLHTLASRRLVTLEGHLKDAQNPRKEYLRGRPG